MSIACKVIGIRSSCSLSSSSKRETVSVTRSPGLNLSIARKSSMSSSTCDRGGQTEGTERTPLEGRACAVRY